MKKLLSGKSNLFKGNAYSAAAVVVVVAAVVLFNMLFQQIVGSKLQFDMTERNLYEISSVTDRVIAGLEDTVTFTVLSEQETADDVVVEFIGRYADLSSKIKLTWINPNDNPDLLDQYGTSKDSIVIACEATGKSTIVKFSDIITMDIIAYYQEGIEKMIFDGDGQLTSAVNLVTNTQEFKIYNVTGHGESKYSETIMDLMNKNSVVMEDFNLLTATSIPEDCGLLMINAPVSDLTTNEITILKDFMSVDRTGNIMILLADSGVETPNLEEFILSYGLELQDGNIADQSSNYQGNDYFIVPTVNVSGDMANDMVTKALLIINSQGFTKVETGNANLSYSSFLTTSKNGRQVSGDEETPGEYILAVKATETFPGEGEEKATYANLTVYGANTIINQQVTDGFKSLENTTLFMNSVMNHFDGGYNVSIATKPLDEPYNNIADPAAYSLLLLVVLPAGILIAGFVVWNKRRKK